VKACDAFRDEAMVNLGVRVEDSASGKSLWKLDDAATLRRELADKRARERAEEISKLKRKLDLKRADADKFSKGLVPPEQMFRVESTLCAAISFVSDPRCLILCHVAGQVL
jgi:cysteinyl-tRNA synthetase